MNQDKHSYSRNQNANRGFDCTKWRPIDERCNDAFHAFEFIISKDYYDYPDTQYDSATNHDLSSLIHRFPPAFVNKFALVISKVNSIEGHSSDELIIGLES